MGSIPVGATKSPTLGTTWERLEENYYESLWMNIYRLSYFDFFLNLVKYQA